MVHAIEQSTIQSSAHTHTKPPLKPPNQQKTPSKLQTNFIPEVSFHLKLSEEFDYGSCL